MVGVEVKYNIIKYSHDSTRVGMNRSNIATASTWRKLSYFVAHLRLMYGSLGGKEEGASAPGACCRRTAATP